MSTAAPSDVHLRRIARGSLVNLVGAVVAALAGLALTVVVTNNWPEATAGALFAAISLFLVLTACALLGTDTGLARFLLRYEAEGRGAEVRIALRTALRPVAATSLVLAVLLLVAAEPVAELLQMPADPGVAVLRVLAVVLPLAVAGDALLAATRALGIMRATVLVDKVLRSGGQPLAVLAVLAGGGGLFALSVGWAVPYVLASGAAVVMLVAVLRARPAQASAEPARPAREISAEFWSYTWPRGIARVFQVALQRLDILLVAALRSPAEAALYTAATRFVPLGQLGVQAVQQVLQPRLTQLLAGGDLVTTARVFRVSTAWIVALSWPVYLVAAVAAPFYLQLFGDEYARQGQTVVVILALSMLLATAAGSVDVLLLMAGRSLLSLANNGAALLVNVALNLVLIPRWGIEGAAVSWAVSLAVRNLLPFWQVRAQLGFTGLGRAPVTAGLAAVACFALPLLVVQLLGGRVGDAEGIGRLAVLATLVGGMIAYALVLWHRRGVLELEAALPARRGNGRG